MSSSDTLGGSSSRNSFTSESMRTSGFGSKSRRKQTHWREISTDSTASASTQCTQNGVFRQVTPEVDAIPGMDKPRVLWSDLSSDEEDDRLLKLSNAIADADKQCDYADYADGIVVQEETEDNSLHDATHYGNVTPAWCENDPTWYGKEQLANEPPRLCLAELLVGDPAPYHMRLDESHLRSLSAFIDETGTPSAYSDSDHEYYGFGVLWVEKDAFKSQDEAHPLSQPLADLCRRQRVSLKRFRSAPNLLRWLTKPRRTSRRQKRSYVCVCAQESKSVIEAFLHTWEGFITVQNEKNVGKPIIYSNQKIKDDAGIRSWSWSRKSYFPTFADACADGFPSNENVAWVKEGENELNGTIYEALQAGQVKNLLQFDTTLSCIQYFTSQVDQSIGKARRRKRDKDKKERDGTSLRIWPSNERKYTVLCKGRAVALETFFRSWKSVGTDGPADRLITYGDITADDETCEVHHIYQEGSLSALMEEAEASLSALQDTKSVNYSQYSSEWSSQCDRDWAPSESSHDRESEPGSLRKRSCGSVSEMGSVRAPPVLLPRWHAASGSRSLPHDGRPKIGCRLVVWRPQGLAPPKGIPAPAWKNKRADIPPKETRRVPFAKPLFAERSIGPAQMRGIALQTGGSPIGSGAIRTSSGSPPPSGVSGFAPKPRLKEPKPKPLRSRPLQSPVRVLAKSLGKSGPNMRRLCTAPLQAPAFPLLAPIQEEQ